MWLEHPQHCIRGPFLVMQRVGMQSFFALGFSHLFWMQPNQLLVSHEGQFSKLQRMPESSSNTHEAQRGALYVALLGALLPVSDELFSVTAMLDNSGGSNLVVLQLVVL